MTHVAPGSPLARRSQPAALIGFALLALALTGCGASAAGRPTTEPLAAPPVVQPAPAPPTVAPAPLPSATPLGAATSYEPANSLPGGPPTPDADGKIVVVYPTADLTNRAPPLPVDYEAWPPVVSVQGAIDALQTHSGLLFTVVKEPGPSDSTSPAEAAELELTSAGQVYRVIIERYPDRGTADMMHQFWFNISLKGYCSAFRSADGLISVAVEPELPNDLYYALKWPLEAD